MFGKNHWNFEHYNNQEGQRGGGGDGGGQIGLHWDPLRLCLLCEGWVTVNTLHSNLCGAISLLLTSKTKLLEFPL